jgi:murein DD-endopeptidase MepM/ murein hydrolase activator NlpD
MNNRYVFTLFLILSVLFFMFQSQSLSEELEQEISIREETIESLSNEMEELETAYREYEDKLYGVGGANSFPETLPVESFVFPIAEEDFLRYTSPFGFRDDPFLNTQMYHRGLDIATVWRAQVVSVADGVVLDHYPPPGARQGNTIFQGHPIYGGMIRIDHGDFQTLYAHLSETVVRTGQQVSAGQFIGRVGNTGYSRGQHLHFEMIIDDENVNPLLYLSELPQFEEN